MKARRKQDSEIDVQSACADIMSVVTKAASLKLSQVLEFVAGECAKEVRAERERCANELAVLAHTCRLAHSTPERIATYEAAAAHIRSLSDVTRDAGSNAHETRNRKSYPPATGAT